MDHLIDESSLLREQSEVVDKLRELRQELRDMDAKLLAGEPVNQDEYDFAKGEIEALCERQRAIDAQLSGESLDSGRNPATAVLDFLADHKVHIAWVAGVVGIFFMLNYLTQPQVTEKERQAVQSGLQQMSRAHVEAQFESRDRAMRQAGIDPREFGPPPAMPPRPGGY